MQVVTVFDFGCHTFAAFDLSLYEKARVGVVIQVSCSQSHACRRYCKAVCIPEPLRSHALVFVSSVCACYLKQSQKGAAYRFACARSQKKASKAGTLQHQAVLTLHCIWHHASVLCDKTVAWAKLGACYRKSKPQCPQYPSTTSASSTSLARSHAQLPPDQLPRCRGSGPVQCAELLPKSRLAS